VAEGRQADELVRMLEQEGAATWRCPMVQIEDAPDQAAVIQWLRELIKGQFSHVVLFTGEGLRRLVACAERNGLREAAIDALVKTRTVTRGPKPVKALRQLGLQASLIAPEPTTGGLMDAMRGEVVRGSVIGVQLFDETNLELVQFLQAQGATVRAIAPYIYVQGIDDSVVADLVQRSASGAVDVIIFTSSPQVDRLFDVIARRSLEDLWNKAKARVHLAAVGPVVADSLHRHGAKADICPEQGWVMKNLVQHTKRALVASKTIVD
jgi:uroporphyrinogen-III synthase